MSDFPDFSSHHYRIEKELGHNRAGGRVTYLAADTRSQQLVVIKQFQFAKSGSSWAEFDAYDREIQVLKELNHRGIPHYLDAFQTDAGFCMVQEYKQAESLAVSRSFSPDEIRQIAIAALEVLVYLQNRIPPVIHRDIKPENILVNDRGEVFLVDFGFARVGEGEVGVSSVVKGTLGFMPPEQLFNRQLSEASDLYGLGMTLICLLTGTKSDRIGDLVDISYRVSFKHLVPKLSFHWVNWLDKMVEPRLKDRFPNAVTALTAIPSSPIRPPEAQLSQATIELQATRLGQLLTHTLTIANPIPETVLTGEWRISPHPHDPGSELYTWIFIEPPSFEGNHAECQVTVDTRKLMAGKTYSRKLLLHTNTLAKTYSVNLQVRTAPVPVQNTPLSYGLLLLLGLVALILGWFTAWVVLVLGAVAEAAQAAGFGAMLGAAIGLEGAAWLLRSSGWRTGGMASTLAAVILGVAAILSVLSDALSGAGSIVIFGAIAGMVSGVINGLALGTAVEKFLTQGTQRSLAIGVSFLASALGTSLGIGFILGLSQPSILTGTTLTSLSLAALITHLNLQRANTLFSHRKAERHLIKP